MSFGLLTKLASHPLRPDEIAGFYRAEAMIARRFEQLEGSDLITDRSGRLQTDGTWQESRANFLPLARRVWPTEPVDGAND